MKKRFHYRSLVSFLLFFSIVWLLISGTVLYISPPGRVAHWQHWALMGFDKEQWQAQHTIFSYFFVIISILHIFSLNWRILWSYVKLKTKSGFRKGREVLVALVLTIVLFIGTSFNIPPLSSFFELGETVGSSWENKQNKAPIPHTENLTLNEISSEYLKIKVEDVTNKLERNGIFVKNNSLMLKEIAEDNNKSPADLYAILTPMSQNISNAGRSGYGYGRMTIDEIATDLDIDNSEVINILQINNIKAKKEQSIKDIAAEYDLHPSEIVGMIRAH